MGGVSPASTFSCPAGIRVVSNAGGVNPQACATALCKMAEEQGVELSVAVVTGDDLTEKVCWCSVTLDTSLPQPCAPDLDTSLPQPCAPDVDTCIDYCRQQATANTGAVWVIIAWSVDCRPHLLQLDDVRGLGVRDMDTGIALPPSVVSTNAYLG